MLSRARVGLRRPAALRRRRLARAADAVGDHPRRGRRHARRPRCHTRRVAGDGRRRSGRPRNAVSSSSTACSCSHGATQEASRPSRVITAIARSAAERAAPTADAARESGLDLELEPALIDGDRPLLERMVANLVDNAVLHNLDRGWISLDTPNGREPRSAARREQRRPCRLCTRADDLFERFHRLDDAATRCRRFRARVVDRRGGGHSPRRSRVGGAAPRRWPRGDCRSAGRNGHGRPYRAARHRNQRSVHGRATSSGRAG